MTAAPDYAELVRRLRDAAPAYRADERDEAADAIEALAARVAELEQLVYYLAPEGRTAITEPFYARIAALEAERDALLADFERYAQHALPSPWHPPGCLTREMHPPSQTFSFKCDCGLDAARARWAKERT